MAKQVNNETEMAALTSITEQHDTQSIGKIDSSNNLPNVQYDPRANKLAYIEVNKDIMSYGAKFYPSDWVFKCRAAMGAEVAHFSTIDNTDPFSIAEGINDILKTCIRITDNKGANISYLNLYEFDRLWFLMFIRDLTFSSPEQSLSFMVNCEHCGKENKVIFSYDNIITNDETETSKKYWDADESAYMVKTRNYGVLKLQPSTLRRATIFSDYIKDWSRNNPNKKPDMGFMKMFWMFINNDNQFDTKVVHTANINYAAVTNDISKFSIYSKLNTELSIGITQQMKYCCSDCEKEAHTDITFPNGLSNIFIMSNIDQELL